MFRQSNLSRQFLVLNNIYRQYRPRALPAPVIHGSDFSRTSVVLLSFDWQVTIQI